MDVGSPLRRRCRTFSVVSRRRLAADWRRRQVPGGHQRWASPLRFPLDGRSSPRPACKGGRKGAQGWVMQLHPSGTPTPMQGLHPAWYIRIVSRPDAEQRDAVFSSEGGLPRGEPYCCPSPQPACGWPPCTLRPRCVRAPRGGPSSARWA